jgi:hypothetical protein
MATSSMEPVSIENPYAQNSEQFANAAPNPLKITADDPVSIRKIINDIKRATCKQYSSEKRSGAFRMASVQGPVLLHT